MTTGKVIVTMRHVRMARMCSEGAREFFRLHNLDWQSFLDNGIDAEVLLAIDDAVANQCVEVARNGQ